MHVRLIPALILLLVSPPALSQTCTFTNTGLNWGDVNLASGTAFNLTGTFQASCNGIAGRTVRVCPNFNAGTGGASANGNERYMLKGASQLRYNMYSNATRTTVWGSRTWGRPPTPPTINVALNASGSGSVSTTIYGSVLSGQSALPAGLYVSDFPGVETQIAYAYSTSGNCNAIGLSNVTSVPFNVKANYPGSCAVSATNLNFGAHGVLDSAISATNAINVTCTTGATYSVALSGGNSGAIDPTQRKMSNPANTEHVTYGIYRDSGHALPWGSSSGTTVSGTGTGSAQAITAYGLVPAQPTPSPQTYSDTITVTISY